jgi:hypothetical protein
LFETGLSAFVRVANHSGVDVPGRKDVSISLASIASELNERGISSKGKF